MEKRLTRLLAFAEEQKVCKCAFMSTNKFIFLESAMVIDLDGQLCGLIVVLGAADHDNPPGQMAEDLALERRT